MDRIRISISRVSVRERVVHVTVGKTVPVYVHTELKWTVLNHAIKHSPL